MKLGNTREEMQRNYASYLKGARKVGKVLMYIFLVVSIISIKYLFQVPEDYVYASAVKALIILFIILYPLCGYVEGHILYFAWKRIEEWCIAIAPDDEGFFSAILGIVTFPIMLSIGQFFGIYDWIKLHIDGKRHGLKMK